MNNRESKLVELAKREFGDLTNVEKKLLTAVVMGEPAEYSAEAEENNDLAKAESWEEERVLNAKIIAWLCNNPQASELVSNRGIQIKGARIEGKLELQNLKVSFSLYFHKCAIPGGIDLGNAKISELILRGILSGSVQANNIEVRGGIHFYDGFKVNGCFSLLCATIRGGLICSNGEFSNPEDDAILLDSINVGGDVFLNENIKAKGCLRLIGASIRGDLDCSKSEFIKSKKEAIRAGRLEVKGNVFFSNDFKTEGEVDLIGATIGGGLVCTNGKFINPNGHSINATNLDVSGSIFFNDNFEAEGEVNIVGASIRGSLICSNGKFINCDGEAISANNVDVGGDVLFDNAFNMNGKINFMGASIGKLFKWVDITSPKNVKLDLKSVKINTLWDDQKSWPQKGDLFLSNLIYEKIYEIAPIDTKSRINWLSCQPDRPFMPQPYEQLAAYYRKIGRDGDAKKILIKKSKTRPRFVKLTPSEWLWYHIFGKIIGYGYRPWRAFWLSLFVIVLGWGVFSIGFSADLITPNKEWAFVSDTEDRNRCVSDDYPKFQSLIYSLDVFVPLVDLQLASNWVPNANKKGELHVSEKFKVPIHGCCVRTYMWFHILAGWILTTFFVVGLTGLIRS